MSYTAIYRKYRPKTFEEVLGQGHITKTLRNQITSGRVGHAYLFNGGRGTGKTSSAKILARAVNCLNLKDGEPCNECEICKAALNGTLTDIVEMDAASNNSVEDIRSIREEVNFLPTVAKYRVYIIDEVHMLSISAFNALLKTLEEPPEHVKFILATTEPQKLPATILSRCQRFDFKKIDIKYIKQEIKQICDNDKINIEDEAINTIAVLAEGAMRDALSLLERCMQENNDKITNEMVKQLVGIPKFELVNSLVNCIVDEKAEQALIEVENLLDDGKDPINISWEIIKYVRDVLVFKTSGKIDIYNNDEQEQIKILANKSEKNRLLKIIFFLSNLVNEMKLTNQKNIMFQVGIMQLCGLGNNNTQDHATLDNPSIVGNMVNEAGNLAINSGIGFAENGNTGNSNQVAAGTTNTKEIEDMQKKISDLELSQKKTINAIKKLISNPQIIHSNGQNVDNSSSKSFSSGIKVKSSSNQNLKNLITDKSEGKDVENWPKIVSGIKESGKVMLYSNLAKTKAIELNDMTVGIKFQDGITPFEKSVIGKSENIAELTKLISMEYGKTMQIRLIDTSNKVVESEFDKITKELDLPLNILE